MRIRKLLVSSCLLLLAISANAQRPEYQKEVIDSLILSDSFTLVISSVTDPRSAQTANQMMIYRDGNPSKMTMSKTITVYDFNKGKKDSKPRYTKDINNDGLLEIIVNGHTGVGTCCNHLNIQSLAKNAVLDVGQIDMRDVNDFLLKDLDNDSIPEVLYEDSHYFGWKTPIKDSPKPMMIWKWHNGEYKLANFSYPDYYLKKVTEKRLNNLAKAIKEWANTGYNPNDDYLKYPPSDLWGVMLDYTYAGEEVKADSVFQKYWPESVPGKDEFYTEFWDKVRQMPYWEFILGSKLE